MKWIIVFLMAIAGCVEQPDVTDDVEQDLGVDMSTPTPDMEPDAEPVWRLVIYDATARPLGERVLAGGRAVGVEGLALTHATVLLERDGCAGPVQFSLELGTMDATPTTPQVASATYKVYRGEDCTGPVYLPRPAYIHMVWDDVQGGTASLWRTSDGLPYQGPRSYYAMLEGGELKCLPWPSEADLFAADPAPQSWSFLTGTPPYILQQERD